jgi:Protein of unknown function (DUF1579)
MFLRKFVLSTLCLIIACSFAMTEEKKAAPSQADMQKMMETYTKLATPGPQHTQMAGMAGTWTTKTKSWMDPSQPPMESTGTCEQKVLLDGRFLQQECTGDMMGQKFNGIGLMAYDNFTKKYKATWMDSMGTGLYVFEGTSSPDGKTINMTSNWDDPMEGPMKARTVTKIIDNNTQVFEMYGTGKLGKEMKMMEMTYTRK